MLGLSWSKPQKVQKIEIVLMSLIVTLKQCLNKVVLEQSNVCLTNGLVHSPTLCEGLRCNLEPAIFFYIVHKETLHQVVSNDVFHVVLLLVLC